MTDRPLLILGGTGRLARLLRRAGLDHALWQGRRVGPGVDLVIDPLADSVTLAAAAARARAILCLAGPTRGSVAELSVHTPLALAALSAGQSTGVPVLLASSAAVYGRPAGPCHEDDPLAPASDYGRAKSGMERAVLAVAADHPVLILRIGNVLGADALLGADRQRRITLDILPDGRAPRRSWIGPRALARVLQDLSLAPPGPPAILNLSLPGAVAMDALLEAAGRPHDRVAAPPSVIPEVCLDVTRLAARVDLSRFGQGAEALVADLRSVGT